MKKVLLAFILLVVAFSLFLVILIPAVIWGIGTSFWKRNLKEAGNELYLWLFSWALSIDQLGNAVYKDLFNDTLIKPKGVPFGNPDETISSVLGKNKQIDRLTRTGKLLDFILDKLDPDHSIKSIEKDEIINATTN